MRKSQKSQEAESDAAYQDMNLEKRWSDCHPPDDVTKPHLLSLLAISWMRLISSSLGGSLFT
ncbi:BQ2448_758 [Microbotryum intermedium]|uniref:BQ2448_758 protein n=1 Tax=Microbotryum intermedium TaxID=269621 RepID=A0A238F692_9BASI|nr:BQ2448_758 [Microbotryum intermedium]